jgi:hypothetical protein
MRVGTGFSGQVDAWWRRWVTSKKHEKQAFLFEKILLHTKMNRCQCAKVADTSTRQTLPNACFHHNHAKQACAPTKRRAGRAAGGREVEKTRGVTDKIGTIWRVDRKKQGA